MHIQHWAKTNNLTLNRHKSKETIVTPSRRSKRAITQPSCLPGIERVTSLKILDVTITDTISMSEHVQDVVVKCAQSLHVIRVLLRRGMNDLTLQAVYRIRRSRQTAVRVQRLWWDFATADDRNRIEAVARRGLRAGLYPADGPTATQLIEEHDDTLFNLLMHCTQHVLHGLLTAEKRP